MPAKRLVGPAQRQSPRLEEERTHRVGDELSDHDVLEAVDWTDDAPGAADGVEILGSRLTRITLTGLELAKLQLVDVELIECELSGAVLVDARWERVVLRRCRLSGLVAAELHATDVLVQDCKADQAWLRSSVLDRCELVDSDLHDTDLHSARVTRTAFRRCDLTGLDVTESHFEQVSLHGSTVDRLKGADSLRGCTIGSDQLVPLALPIFGARGITVDDDPPDLVE